MRSEGRRAAARKEGGQGGGEPSGWEQRGKWGRGAWEGFCSEGRHQKEGEWRHGVPATCTHSGHCPRVACLNPTLQVPPAFEGSSLIKKKTCGVHLGSWGRPWGLNRQVQSFF